MENLEDYAKNKVLEKFRFRALVVVSKYSRCENLDPVVPYYAMNYFDRYILRGNRLPMVMGSTIEHEVELLAMCCLTLAWKLRSNDFKIPDFRRRHRAINVVTPKLLKRMELRICEALDWRLNAATALCFVPYFAFKFNMTANGDSFSLRTINEIIIQSQQITLVAKQKPSGIAASAFLAASTYLYPQHVQSFYDQLFSAGLFREMHERRFINCVIKLCHDLGLVIESTHEPKRWVRAGVESTQGIAETSERDSAGTSKQDSSKNSVQWPSETLYELFADEDSDQVAMNQGEQSNCRTSSQNSKQDSAEKSKQGSTETLSEQSTGEESKQVAINQGEQSNAGRSSEKSKEDSPEKCEQGSDETLSEDSKQVATKQGEALTASASSQKSKQGSNETSSEQMTTEESKQVAMKKGELANVGASSAKSKQRSDNTSSEESKQVATNQGEISNAKASSQKSKQDSAEKTKQGSNEISSEEYKQVKTNQGEPLNDGASSQRSKKGSNGASSKISTVEESKQLTIEESKKVETNQGEASNDRKSSRRGAYKGKEKAVDTTIRTEEPKMAIKEESKDKQLDFPLRWRIGLICERKFVIFRPPSESAEIDQLAEKAFDEDKEEEEEEEDYYYVNNDTESAQLARVRSPQNCLLNNCSISCCNPL